MRRVLPLVLVLLAVSPANAQRYVNPNEKVSEPQRPAALMPLYMTQLTLHGLDLHSTLQALDLGHREANPMLENATDRQMIGAKLAASTLTILVTEKLWKKNRIASVILMTGMNVALAGVVANNYNVADRPRRR